MTGLARGTIEMAIAMTLSGTIGWFVLMSGRSPDEVVLWRCVFGALVLGAACVVSGALPRRLTRRQWGLCLASGAAIVLNWLLLFGAFPRVGIAGATILYNMQPFLLVILGRMVLRETLTWGRLGWLALSFAGFAMTVANGLAATRGDQLTGVAMALGAAACWAAAAMQTKLLSDVPPQLIALIHMLVGILFLAPASIGAFDMPRLIGWAMLAAIGLIHTGFVYLLMYAAIHRLPTPLQGALSFLNPVAAILVDILAFGHRVTWTEIAGVTVILGAAGGMAGWHRPLLRAIASRLPPQHHSPVHTVQKGESCR